MSSRRWSLHACALDSYDRKWAGVMHRVHLNTPWFHFAFAYTPKWRFAAPLVDPWLSEYKAVGPGHEPEQLAARREIMKRAEFGRARWTMFRWHEKEKDALLDL